MYNSIVSKKNKKDLTSEVASNLIQKSKPSRQQTMPSYFLRQRARGPRNNENHLVKYFTCISQKETPMERDWKTLERPSRVLSAYNFEQHNVSFKNEDGATASSARKIGFKDLGKIVGRRWRRLSQHPEKIAEFVEAATMDKERYRKEMLAFKEKRKLVTKMLREETKNDNQKKRKLETVSEDLRPATNTRSNISSTYPYAVAENSGREDRKQKTSNTEWNESKEKPNTIFHGWGGANNGHEYLRPPTQSFQGTGIHYPPAALGDQAAATTSRSMDWEHPASRWPHYYQPPFYPYAVSDGRYAAGYRAWNTTAETVEGGTSGNNEGARYVLLYVYASSYLVIK
mmetsp:Transcript_27815/g.39806  ORF Transcript_27815/g.39806 Transcript_27815/m.39806 type:complete len:343 (+) Transcript_27815:699-1727(+)